MADAAAREERDRAAAGEPRDAVGRVARVGVLGQQDEQRAAELGVQRREDERQERLRDAGARRHRGGERLEALGRGEPVNEGDERRRVHATGGDAPRRGILEA